MGSIMKWIKSLCLVLFLSTGTVYIEARPMTVDDALTIQRPRYVVMSRQVPYSVAYTLGSSIWTVSPGKAPQQTATGNAPQFGLSGALYYFKSSPDTRLYIKRLNQKEELLVTCSASIKTFFVSPDEKKIAFILHTPRNSLVLFNLQEKSFRQLSLASHHVSNASWNPSSNALVYAAQTEKITSDNLDSKGFIISLHKITPKPLFSVPTPFLQPLWKTPHLIVFSTVSTYPGQWRGSRIIGAYTVNTRMATLFPKTKEQTIPRVYGFSPSDNAIYYLVEEKVSYHLYKLPLNSGMPVAVTKGRDIWEDFSFSPTFDTTAFVKEGGNLAPDIYTSPFPELKPSRITTLNGAVSKLDMGEVNVIQWKAKDGEIIEGILLKPVGYSPKKTYPLLVILHGGPASNFSNRFANGTWSYPTQVFAGLGTLVFMPNPRGSTGYGKAFQSALIKKWGEIDYTDVLSGVDYLTKTLKIADPTRMGVAGWSYGGYLTAVMISKNNLFKAASVGAGFSDLFTLYSTIDIPDWMESYLGESPFKDPNTFFLRSPIFRLNAIQTPTLIQHGSLDTRVPVSQARLLYKALKSQEVPVSLQEFSDEGHIISRYDNKKACMMENLRWFSRWLDL
jgi:acetyl esterase/lipase